MKFGLFFLVTILLILGGGFAWLAFTDMPVHQREMTVEIPIAQ